MVPTRFSLAIRSGRELCVQRFRAKAQRRPLALAVEGAPLLGACYSEMPRTKVAMAAASRARPSSM